MKIEEIIETLKYACQGCLSETLCENCNVTKSIATLERLRPVTITDDPATWPPEDIKVIIGEDRPEQILLVNRKSNGHPFIFDYCSKADAFVSTSAIGLTWQYLPEWEG